MFPTKPATLDRFEGDKAVLRTDDGQEFVWPRAELPSGVAAGSVLTMALFTNIDLTEERTKLAKTILNEILGHGATTAEIR